MTRFLPAGVGTLAMLLAISSLGTGGSFAVTFLYVASTLLVGGAATLLTIRGIAGPGRRKSSGRPEPGFFEAACLIGIFVVSPVALSVTFWVLRTLVGSP